MGKKLTEAGRLKLRPLCIYGSDIAPESAIPSTSLNRCIARAVYMSAVNDQTPAFYISSGLEGCCGGGQHWMGFQAAHPKLKYFVTIGTPDFHGGAAEHLKASPELFEEQSQRSGKITPVKYVVVSPITPNVEDKDIRSIVLFGGCEQIRNLAGLAAYHSADPFYKVLMSAGPTCATMITFPAGMAENAPKDSAFVGPTDPTGNVWLPPDLMAMGIPTSVARQMAADVDGSFIGKRSKVAYPVRKVP